MYKYEGTELLLFERAVNWKHYFCAIIEPFVSGPVLEVGAGLGGTTAVMAKRFSSARPWVCLEPDKELILEFSARQKSGLIPLECEMRCCLTAQLPPSSRFNTIIYSDVLEHIADDRSELWTAAGLLNRGGRLIVISPAHQFLFSPFDSAVGHHRRYSASSLRALTPAGTVCLKTWYLDSAGTIASFGNKCLLRRGHPTDANIQFWDKRLVPISRLVDPLLRFTFGKSVIAVYESVAEQQTVD